MYCTILDGRPRTPKDLQKRTEVPCECTSASAPESRSYHTSRACVAALSLAAVFNGVNFIWILDALDRAFHRVSARVRAARGARFGLRDDARRARRVAAAHRAHARHTPARAIGFRAARIRGFWGPRSPTKRTAGRAKPGGDFGARRRRGRHVGAREAPIRARGRTRAGGRTRAKPREGARGTPRDGRAGKCE